jgi:exosortase/archaeosortase family protein
MFSLSAMGLLYLYLMQRTSLARNLIIMAAILPIAFAANVVRVMVLILVTYHLGDEAGQGFLHGFAGIMLFIVGLLFLFVLDWVLGFIFPDRVRARMQA